MKYLSIVAATLVAASPIHAQESSDPIKLTLHDWSGQLVTTTLMGEVLKEAGYNIEYVQADWVKLACRRSKSGGTPPIWKSVALACQTGKH